MIIDIDPKEIVEKRINPAYGLQPDTEERKPRQALIGTMEEPMYLGSFPLAYSLILLR